MTYDENVRPDLGPRLARPLKSMHTGVNSVPIHLRYYCHNTDNKDAL